MTEQELDMWKVFVPYDILMSPSGFICGQVNRQLNLVYVSGINDDMSMTCDDIVGYWASDGETQTLNESRNCQHFVYLNKSSAGELLCQCLTDSRPSLCSCVIYRPEDFVRSYFVTCREDLLNHEGRTSQRSFIQTIVTYIQGSRRKKTCENTGRSLFSPFYVMVQFVIWIVGLLYQLRVVVDNRFTRQYSVLRQVLHTPAITAQLSKRCHRHVMSLDRSVSLRNLRCMDAVSRQMVDTGLGVAIMYLLMRRDTTDAIAMAVSTWADHTADSLALLLEWLMGVPAGLKLNAQLTQYLGHFFLYHIYLWKGYLFLLRPILGTVLWYSLSVGIGGVTAQICVLQDIVSMMTLHIYCFYVYAARLYRLQVYTLSALWRLFRGKKWNTLRQRVDSSSFDVDQLFVGTLLFIILLFMLPTTMLYYAVFTLLRLLILVVHGVLTTIVQFLNRFPVHAVSLWFLSPSSVTENIVFSALPSDKDNGDCVFSMQVAPPSVFRLIDLSHKLCSSGTEDSITWGHFISCLMKGHLVYPWIDLNGEKSHGGSRLSG